MARATGALPPTTKSAKVTIDLGDRGLYRSLKIAAAEQDHSVRDIVIEAIRFWLRHQRLVEATLAGETTDRVLNASSGERIPLDQATAELRERGDLDEALFERAAGGSASPLTGEESASLALEGSEDPDQRGSQGQKRTV